MKGKREIIEKLKELDGNKSHLLNHMMSAVSKKDIERYATEVVYTQNKIDAIQWVLDINGMPI